MSSRASLSQDVFLGSAPRLRGRRLAPFEEARVRLLVQLDLGQTLEAPEIATWCEAIGVRTDVVVLEPRDRGEGLESRSAELVADFRALLQVTAQRWPDGLPLVAVGHGIGGAVALAAAEPAAVEAIVLLGSPLASAQPPARQDWLRSLDPARRIRECAVPLLILAQGPESVSDELLAATTGQARTVLIRVNHGDRGLLQPPWPEVIAGWAESAVKTDE